MSAVRQDLTSDGSEFQVCGAATEKTDARTQFAFLGRSAAAGVPAAAVVRFCELLKAGGDRLVMILRSS